MILSKLSPRCMVAGSIYTTTHCTSVTAYIYYGTAVGTSCLVVVFLKMWNIYIRRIQQRPPENVWSPENRVVAEGWSQYVPRRCNRKFNCLRWWSCLRWSETYIPQPPLRVTATTASHSHLIAKRSISSRNNSWRRVANSRRVTRSFTCCCGACWCLKHVLGRAHNTFEMESDIFGTKNGSCIV